MPKSKSKRVRRQPPPKPKPKQSPAWVAAIFFTLLVGGVVVIIAHYLAEGERPYQLWVGLGMISAGFMVATQWH